MTEKPIAAGSSSFDLIDQDRFFAVLGLRKGTVLLDVGCGIGSYALAVSGRMGARGRIHAVDLWQEGIDILTREIDRRRIRNIRPSVADVSRRMPVADWSIDVCLMATVLHDFIADGTAEGTLREVKRVLKPGGSLAVVEFEKVEGPPGPPRAIRLAPDELDSVLAPHGFRLRSTTSIGPYTYLSVYGLGR